MLASEPISGELLDAALGDDDASEAEVMVVAPALSESKLDFWTSASDEAIAKAEAVADETVERLEEAGVDAVGDTGDSDPLTAVQDALATFQADRIVIFTHPDRQLRYREEDLTERIRERFGVPVMHTRVAA